LDEPLESLVMRTIEGVSAGCSLATLAILFCVVPLSGSDDRTARLWRVKE
jgi:hypothetical protein